MVIRSSQNTRESFTKNVSFMFIVYWGILVLWQNVSNAELRGTADLSIKIGLLAYFVIFYLVKGKTLNTKALAVMVLGCSLLITAGSESQFPLSSLVAYLYPILILLMVYGVGDKLQINRSQLVAFCNCVIGITMYAAVYALIFCWDQFSGALSVQYAYGNELSSFFVSNFEYGMYLLAAIISCVLCLSLTPNMTKRKRTLYVATIILFSINLILTFSRTTILGLILFLLIYMLMGKGKGKRWLVAILVAIALILLFSPELRVFITDIVFKDNNMAGRDVLFEQGLRYYENGTAFQKLFGYGIHKTQLYFDMNFDHSNVHNAYLQTMLYYGLVSCVTLIIFMMSQVVIHCKMLKKDRYLASILLGLTFAAILIMFATTAVIFNSSIDSFFLTAFFVIVPKYIRNSINAGTFYT